MESFYAKKQTICVTFIYISTLYHREIIVVNEHENFMTITESDERER